MTLKAKNDFVNPVENIPGFFCGAFGENTGFFVGNPVSSGKKDGNIDTAEKYWLPNGLLVFYK